MLTCQGVLRRRGLVVIFRLFEIKSFCFFVAVCDLVHDLKTLFHIHYLLC